MKKISQQELRSVIKSVIKEASEDREFPSMDTGSSYDEDWVKEYPKDDGSEDGERISAADIDERFGDGTVDELVGSAGYDDEAGDLSAIDRLFDFESYDYGESILATDRRTGKIFFLDASIGIWEQVWEPG